MRPGDFEDLVRRLTSQLPRGFLEGITAVEVSPGALPHPVRAGVYTLGECIPEPLGDPALNELQSRVVLYYGSFDALARQDPEFDWRAEAWETLTHEVRHHLEWRARTDVLGDLDLAAEHNFARHEGAEFDPLFYLEGEPVDRGLYRVDHDYFFDRVVRRIPARLSLSWHGHGFRVSPPAGASLPAFLNIRGVADPPPGELLLVLRRRPSLLALFRPPEVFRADVAAETGRPGSGG